MTARLDLPQVTLVAVTSVNLAATVRALAMSMQDISFGAVKLLTDQPPAALPSGVECHIIAPILSAEAYSDFVLRHLAGHIATSHCLLIQWDGHVVNPALWRPEFLDYDYIGASWPQFTDGKDVGNGGFSLRSLALLDACRDGGFPITHPEDVVICRDNRDWLEARGLRFAPRELAVAFSAERSGDPAHSFGFHGVWHMPQVLGRDAFWQVYAGLDERTTVRHDFTSLLWQMAGGKAGAGRIINMIYNRIRDAVRRRGTGR